MYQDYLRAAGLIILGALLLLSGCYHNDRYGREAEDAFGPIRHAPNGGGMASYRGQTSCPVCGKKLGEPGKPVPVVVNGETIYACCPDCASKVEHNPDGYLAKVNETRTVRKLDGER